MKRPKTNFQKMSRMLTIVILLATIPFAVILLNKKVGQMRNIASTGEESVDYTAFDYDLSEATPDEFTKAFKYQVLKDVSVIQTNLGPSLRLGLFLMTNDSGGKVFVCDRYPTVDLVFSAEGVAFSGEIPQMILRVPCTVATDQKHLETLPIPFATVRRSPLTQYEFDVTGESTIDKGKLFFRNVVEFWPTEWTWTGVKFYGVDPQDTLQINGYEIISVLGEPLILNANE